MKNKEKKLKEYEKGLVLASSHHLLGTISNMVNTTFVDPNSNNKDFNFNKNSYAYLSVYGDTSASLYLNREQKLKEHEWAFVISVAFVVLAFDLYRSSKISNLLSEKSVILFATDYVYNILGLKEVPEKWNGYHKISQEISFKNEYSVLEQLKNKDFLIPALFNFLNYEDNSIRLNAKRVTYGMWGNSTLTFNEQFARTLVEQAQRTIALKANKGLSEESLKVRNLPINKAQKWFITHYPLLAGLAASFEIILDVKYCQKHSIEIAAVSASDKMIFINPNAQLSEEGLKFVIAHEILHVALGHMSRRKGREPLMWNLACDFVINHWLVEMRVGVPPEGVFLDRDLANKSADEIYLLIAKDVKLRKKMMTFRSKTAGNDYNEPGGNSFNNKNKNNCDMLDEDIRYFSDFEDACAKALLRGFFIHQNIGRGNLPASLEEEIRVLNQPAIPWQVDLARWIAERFPLEESRRTYARPSRRQSSTPDIPRPRYVRPEEEKNTRTFGVIMDTSGSMDKQLLGKCVGAIVSYATAQEVKSVRLVFCDAQTYDEGYVDIDKLINKIKVKGRGGTVLQQAVNYLENINDFPKEAPILILSDGFFEPDLKVTRDHAFLVPNKTIVRKQVNGEVFEFK